MRLIILLRRNQPANNSMLQKERIADSRNSATQNEKLLLKTSISNLREIWSNTALFEFGLAKSKRETADLAKTAALTKSEVQERFPKYLRFHPPVIKGPFHKMGKQ